MSAKQITENQHIPLHLQWPNNCCLCQKEEEIELLKKRIDDLEKVLQNLINNLESILDLWQRQPD